MTIAQIEKGKKEIKKACVVIINDTGFFRLIKLKIEIMSLRGSRVNTRRRLVIISRYTSSNLSLNDEDMVELEERGILTETLSIEDMIERFEEMPSVQTYGIERVEIFIRDTNESERVIRTRWDIIREERNRLRRIEIERQIQRLQNELISI